MATEISPINIISCVNCNIYSNKISDNQFSIEVGLCNDHEYIENKIKSDPDCSNFFHRLAGLVRLQYDPFSTANIIVETTIGTKDYKNEMDN